MIDQCFELLKSIDEQYNSYSQGSYFDRINKNAGNWVEVDETTIWLLNELDKMKSISNGIYNVAVMPLLRLWGFYQNRSCSLPSFDQIALLTEQLKGNVVSIKDNQVKLTRGNELITGSFIKAYAVDQVVAFLKAKGVTDALINAGGSTIYAMNDQGHPYWKINIPHPTLEDGSWFQIHLSNECLSLSGRKSSFITIDDKQYSHIINVATGWPSLNYQAVTLTSSAFYGDVISTVLMANDTDKKVNENLKQAFKDKLKYYVINDAMPAGIPVFIEC
ncbi:hypothetical protein GCM10023231_17300 [Olivibacter ginsenosidimutans]|uniref:FAD:protein FMN transferase n=1 Tax=Olivibacter ginsenosidimutans TaxID=1176537 RepID=A0ABP9B415_9SPHI